MLPPRFPGGAQGEPWSERQTYNAFQQLDDRWTVLYSVAWQSKRHGKEGDGEADFVLIHPDYGILVVEVKGGSRIDLVEGEWFSERRGQMVSIKNPFDQATDSKHYLGRWLSERIAGFQGAAHIGHFVVFPAHTQEGDLGPGGPRAIICDRTDLGRPVASLERIGNHWANRRLTSDQINQVVKELRPTVSIRRFLRDGVEEVTRELEALTDEQIRALRILRLQRRVTIRGAAGTGKTVLATARARELDRQGYRTLLLCYNKLLSDRLREDLADTNVTVDSFHGLCHEYVDAAGLMSGLKSAMTSGRKFSPLNCLRQRNGSEGALKQSWLMRAKTSFRSGGPFSDFSSTTLTTGFFVCLQTRTRMCSEPGGSPPTTKLPSLSPSTAVIPFKLPNGYMPSATMNWIPEASKVFNPCSQRCQHLDN